MHELFTSRSFSTTSPLGACQDFLAERWRGFRVTRRLLPRELRDDLVTLLAWHAVVRERVKLASSEAELLRALDDLRGVIEGAFSPEADTLIATGLRHAAHDHGIDRLLFLEPLEEYARFESVRTFETRALLLKRARNLTRAEGRMLLQLFGLEGERCQLLAETLGRALILTHWLETFREDFRQGRLHFAMEDLSRHGVRVGALQRGADDSRTRALVQSQIAWARELFERGWPLCSELGPIRGRKLAFVLRWQAARLSAMEANDHALFSKPCRGGLPRLLACGLASLVSRRSPRLR